MSSFDDFAKAIVSGSEALAKNTLQGFVDDARDDAKAFLEKNKGDLSRWTKMLIEQHMTKAEFSDLVRGQAALVELHALTEAGIALTRLQQFRDGLIDLVIDTAFKTCL
jgi:hypothetical protein